MKRLSPFLAVLLASAVVLAGGCSSFRKAADRGHRTLDRPGGTPSKVAASLGAAVGFAAGIPFSILLLPTYPFEELTYSSSPDGDVPMPILYAPLGCVSGLGAFIAASPFYLFQPSLGTPEEPSEEPPPRDWKAGRGDVAAEAPSPPPAKEGPGPSPGEGDTQRAGA